MTTKTRWLIVAVMIWISPLAYPSQNVPAEKDRIHEAEYIITGKLEAEPNGKFYITTHSSIKGGVATGAKFLVTTESGIAWYVRSGGGFMPPPEDEFPTYLKQKKWYGKKIIFLGSERGGRWISQDGRYGILGFNPSKGYDPNYVQQRAQEIQTGIERSAKKKKEGEANPESPSAPQKTQLTSPHSALDLPRTPTGNLR